MFAGWLRLSGQHPDVIQCAKLANGQWWQEILGRVNAGECEAYSTPYGTLIIEKDFPEFVLVGFHGERIGEALGYVTELVKQTGQFEFIRFHTESPGVLRLWRKAGIVPTEFIARINLNG